MKKSDKFLKAFNNFKVSKYTKVWFTIPAVILAVAIIVIVSIGATTGNYSNAVGIGIDFEGGTILTVTLDESKGYTYDGEVDKIKDAIQSEGVAVSYTQREDGVGTEFSMVFRYKNIDGDDATINERNIRIRDKIDALYPDIINAETTFITYESIGATAASDLLSKAGIAIAVSTLLILIYIVFRFTLVSGIAAVLALLHDVIILFALTVICRIQINTSFVAAVITIIAYSINNTIIIFDRCRETLKPLKGQKNINYREIGDNAVIENMNRTVLTTVTTMFAIIFLAILGSDSIREFAVPIILGLVAGFYSSVFLATPMWSALSYQYDKLREKYATRKGVTYEKKDEEEVDLTVAKDKREDDDEFVSGRSVKTAGESTKAKSASKPQNKPKNKPIYKYSKKNTTFKKK